MKYASFDFDWRFQEGAGRFFMFPGGPAGEKVNLPHDYIIEKHRDPLAVSGAATGFYPGGDGCYTKDFDLPETWQDKTVLLMVDGAYMNSEVTLNGDLLNLHPYGYTAYTVDLTDHLRAKNSLMITTRCTQPNTRWYSGAGLYRSVGVLVGGKTYVHPWDVFITTPEVSPERAVIQVSFEVTGPCENGVIRARAESESGEIVAAGQAALENGKALLTMSVAQPELWDVDAPALHTLRWTLLENGETLDAGEASFGIRKIEIDPKNGFRLNGKPMKLRGGCIHHDNAMLGACAYPDAECRKIRRLKDAGYNAIRTAHNPPSSALLTACDQIGMLVLDESFDMWRTGKNPMDYHLWFEDWWQRDTAAMVKRDRNHPCIYCWSIGNEIGEMLGTSNGAYWARVQADYVRALDPTRPVSASANGFVAPDPEKPPKPHDFQAELVGKPVMGLPKDGEDEWGRQTEEPAKALDLFGYNYLYGRYAYDAEKFPERVIHATETHSFHMYDYWQACLKNANCIGDFTWTAYDNLGEAGAGRVLYDPEGIKKGFMGAWPWLSCYQGDLDLIGDARPQNFYRRVLWGLDKGVHLFTTPPCRTGKPFYGMGWHWEDVLRSWTFDEAEIGKPVNAQAYADCDEVEFYVNGRLAGKAVPVEYKAACEIPYEKGTLEVRAITGGQVVATDRLETTGEPAAIVLTPEMASVSANGMDLIYIRAEVVDAEGRAVTHRDVKLTVEVSGAATFLGIGSGNPCTDEDYTHARNTFRGAALICARAGQAGGDATISVSCEGLPEVKTTVKVI
ncbi:MAG: glycoside hydrolase family 2 TIM barrel-domain containing protein [Eubacteriales bacterium]|nr:glycoside hydrolase family 2 TIM barrel-domain containing protein [Eubacteriales bacterium]